MGSKKRRIRHVEAVVFAVLFTVAIAVSVPMIRKQQRNADFEQTWRNMRPVSLAILEFNQEFGEFPSGTTHPIVMEATGHDPGPWTGSANDCFRQLIAYGIQSEDIFFAVHPEGSHEPDNVIGPLASEALKPGEVGLSYIYGLKHPTPPGTPILIAPMKTGTHLLHDIYDGRVAVISMDAATLPCTVNRRGEVLLPDGTLLFDPARRCWQNHPIDIRHPEFPN